MWQYQKLSSLFALGLVAIATSTGCATSVEDPVLDEQEMVADETAESSEALSTDWGAGYYGGYGGYYGRGFLGDKYGYGYGGYGYGDWGGLYGGYGDWGAYGAGYGNNVNIIIEQDNVVPPVAYPYGGFYGDSWGAGYGGFYGGYGDCGYGGFLGDDWW